MTYSAGRLDLGPSFRREEGKSEYGRRISAPCSHCHNRTFDIFSDFNGRSTQPTVPCQSPYGPLDAHADEALAARPLRALRGRRRNPLGMGLSANSQGASSGPSDRHCAGYRTRDDPAFDRHERRTPRLQDRWEAHSYSTWQMDVMRMPVTPAWSGIGR